MTNKGPLYQADVVNMGKQNQRCKHLKIIQLHNGSQDAGARGGKKNKARKEAAKGRTPYNRKNFRKGGEYFSYIILYSFQ